jgi:chaperonin GroEL
MEEGIVPGAGTAYLRVIPMVEKVNAPGDERLGVRVVVDALRAPLAQIGDNTGIDGPAIVAEVEEYKGSMGFDAVNRKIRDLTRAGIVDAVKVLRLALENAASIAAMSLVSDTIITEVAKGKKAVEGAVT